MTASTMMPPAEPSSSSSSSSSSPPLGKVAVRLTGTQETLLVPLMARAHDAQRPRPLLNDAHAGRVLDRVDHDLAKFGAAGPVGVGTRDLCVVRARQLDDWAAAFLARHRGDGGGVTVVHLACGLDSRCLRLDWAGPGARWYDVDLPDVVALRRRLVPPPAHGDYRLVAADVAADDDAWLRALPADRPALVVLEGLTPYLAEADGRRLLRRLAARFPAGQILCDGVGPAMRRLGGLLGITSATGAVFRWGIADPRALEALHPRLALRDYVRPAELDGALETFVWPHRLFMSACARVPRLDNLVFYLRFEF